MGSPLFLFIFSLLNESAIGFDVEQGSHSLYWKYADSRKLMKLFLEREEAASTSILFILVDPS